MGEKEEKDTQLIELTICKKRMVMDMVVDEVLFEAAGIDSKDALNTMRCLIKMMKNELNT